MLGDPPPTLKPRRGYAGFPCRCSVCNARSTGPTDGDSGYYTCGSKWILLGSIGQLDRIPTFFRECRGRAGIPIMHLEARPVEVC